MNIDLGDLAAILMAISMIYFTWKKTPSEKRSLDGDATESEASAAEKRAGAAEKYEQMVDRQATKIANMQTQIDTLECEVGELKEALKERDTLLQEWQAGISLLINQLVANRLTPVWVPRGHKPALGDSGGQT